MTVNGPVKINGKLPPHEGSNGLHDAAMRLAAEPRSRHVLIVAADLAETKTVHMEEDGDEWDEVHVTLRVRAVEEMSGERKREAERLMAQSRELREAHGRNRALSLFAPRDGAE